MTRNKLPAAIDAELAKEFKFGTESENTKWFCDVAERYNVQHYALAGSVFQMGLPDRMFICPDGNIRLIEFKRDARLVRRIAEHRAVMRILSRMYPHEAAKLVIQSPRKYDTSLVEKGVAWKQLKLRGAQHDMISRASRGGDPKCLVVVQSDTPGSWVTLRGFCNDEHYVPIAYGVAEILTLLTDGQCLTSID
jgi:hypothetical protein